MPGLGPIEFVLVIAGGAVLLMALGLLAASALQRWRRARAAREAESSEQ